MTPQQMTELTNAIIEGIQPHLRAEMLREIEGRVRQEARELLYTLAGESLRAIIREELDKQITVTLQVKTL